MGVRDLLHRGVQRRARRRGGEGVAFCKRRSGFHVANNESKRGPAPSAPARTVPPSSGESRKNGHKMFKTLGVNVPAAHRRHGARGLQQRRPGFVARGPVLVRERDAGTSDPGTSDPGTLDPRDLGRPGGGGGAPSALGPRSKARRFRNSPFSLPLGFRLGFLNVTVIRYFRCTFLSSRFSAVLSRGCAGRGASRRASRLRGAGR